MAAPPPLPRRGAHQRTSIEGYDAWFTTPTAQGEREGRGKLVPSHGVAGESPRGPFHGRRPWSSPELAENGPRDHETAQERYAEKEGEKAMLTTAKTEAMAAQFGGTARGGFDKLAASSGTKAETGMEQMRKRKGARARTRLKSRGVRERRVGNVGGGGGSACG